MAAHAAYGTYLDCLPYLAPVVQPPETMVHLLGLYSPPTWDGDSLLEGEVVSYCSSSLRNRQVSLR